MLESILALIFTVVLRILTGYLATVYPILQEWLIWFSVLAIVTAVLAAVFIIVRLIGLIVDMNKDKQ